MGFGKYNISETVRERKIRALDDELRVIDLYKGEAGHVIGNEAEDYFVAWVKGRHGHRVLRAGWPDFLLVDKATGKPFAVEVKTGSDRLSRRQANCFEVLEKAGIPVFVWSPETPKVITPWRAYAKRKGPRFRDDAPKTKRESRWPEKQTELVTVPKSSRGLTLTLDCLKDRTK